MCGSFPCDLELKACDCRLEPVGYGRSWFSDHAFSHHSKKATRDVGPYIDLVFWPSSDSSIAGPVSKPAGYRFQICCDLLVRSGKDMA